MVNWAASEMMNPGANGVLRTSGRGRVDAGRWVLAEKRGWGKQFFVGQLSSFIIHICGQK